MFTDSIEEIKERLAKNSIYWNYEKGNVNTSIEKLKLEEIRYKSIYKRTNKICEKSTGCDIISADEL